MSRLAKVTSLLRKAGWPLTAALARARQASPRPTRFAGAWPSRDAALAALPAAARRGYDDPAIADISFEAMARISPADYPVLFWMHRVIRPQMRLLDAGGHLGTKYLAFREVLPLEAVDWTVQDLPGIVTAARAAQAEGRLPAALHFETRPDGLAADLLLASGLLQYLDLSLTAYLGALAAPPRYVVLNKVATRTGPEVVTLERIGPARVPYRIRDRAAIEAEIDSLGYEIRDQWELPGLGHVIPTHPWLGASVSRGYLLERRDAT